MKSYSFNKNIRNKHIATDVIAYKLITLNPSSWEDIWDEDSIIIEDTYPVSNLIYNTCAWTGYNKKVLNKFRMSSKIFKTKASFGKIPGVKHKSW